MVGSVSKKILVGSDTGKIMDTIQEVTLCTEELNL